MNGKWAVKTLIITTAILYSLIYSATVKSEPDPLWYLAEAIYYEARGEQELGQYAVAHVIMNRTKKINFPDTVHAVIYQRRQFSYTTDGSLNTPIKYNSKQWYTARKIAAEVYLGSYDITGGADHYQNIKTATDGSWRFGMRLQGRFGNHWFYKRDHK